MLTGVIRSLMQSIFCPLPSQDRPGAAINPAPCSHHVHKRSLILGHHDISLYPAAGKAIDVEVYSRGCGEVIQSLRRIYPAQQSESTLPSIMLPFRHPGESIPCPGPPVGPRIHERGGPGSPLWVVSTTGSYRKIVPWELLRPSLVAPAFLLLTDGTQ